MRTEQAFVVLPCESNGEPALNVFGHQIFVKLSGNQTDGGYAIMEDLTPPRSGPPLHRHNREDESWYVISGEYRFVVDGKEIQASQGCTVHAPRGTTHTFQNLGTTSGRLLIIVQPAGLDEFFRDIDKGCAGMTEPDLSVIVPIFEKHGLELLGPPLSAERDSELKAAS